MAFSGNTQYEGLALIADPIHNYITFTVPFGKKDEVTEKEIIDSKWVQRLRYINQLQSARWVYPSAEHSRFVHSLGAMHIAGRFARHLYPSLKQVVPDAPSLGLIESILRLSVLLHDVGHGPFCHFFDHNFLNEYALTHEKLGQAIIKNELAPLLSRVRRSPSAAYEKGEAIEPEQIAFLIGKDEKEVVPTHYPRWLTILKPLFSGIFTADNMDYVLRDSYLCGIATGPVDIDRLIYYTYFTQQGLTLHQAGLSALTMFLNARSYLYYNVYYHRTTRALDIQLKEIFYQTLHLIFPHNPLDCLDDYIDLTDWSLLLEVKSWERSRSRKKQALFEKWNKILLRDVKWKMAYERTFSITKRVDLERVVDPNGVEKKIRRRLPTSLKTVSFQVDMAVQDPRPNDLARMGERQLYVYNPSTRNTSAEGLMAAIGSIPAFLIQCRIFALNHDHDTLLSGVAEAVLDAYF